MTKILNYLSQIINNALNINKDIKEPLFDIETFVQIAKKKIGHNKGGVYLAKKKSLEFNKILVKSDNPSNLQAELVASHILRLVLNNDAAKYSFIKMKKSNYLASEFIEKLINLSDLPMQIQQRVKNCGKIFIAAFLVGDNDLHRKNICALEDQENGYRAVKIDHGMAFGLTLNYSHKGQASYYIKNLINKHSYPVEIFITADFKQALHEVGGISLVSFNQAIDKGLEEINRYYNKGFDNKLYKRLSKIINNKISSPKELLSEYIAHSQSRLNELLYILNLEDALKNNDLKEVISILSQNQYLLFVPINWMRVGNNFFAKEHVLSLSEYVIAYYGSNTNLLIAIKQLQSKVIEKLIKDGISSWNKDLNNHSTKLWELVYQQLKIFNDSNFYHESYYKNFRNIYDILNNIILKNNTEYANIKYYQLANALADNYQNYKIMELSLQSHNRQSNFTMQQNRLSLLPH